MFFNIIIADDQEEVLKNTIQVVSKIIQENNLGGKIVMSTQNPNEVIEFSKKYKNEINVYILDINYMDEINGFSIARAIRESEPNAYIIFLTAFIQLSMLTFRYRLKAFDFLVKPVAYSDLEECMKDLIQDMKKVFKDNKFNHKYINIKSGYQEHQIDVSEIIYIESFGPKLIFHLCNGGIETYGTLKELEGTLSKFSDSFKRSHKSYLINHDYVSHIDFDKNEIIMSNGEKCFISRSQKAFYRDFNKKL
jgi:DNA-binding LytR/AlgR family response regulator